jgi:hypothetical protein
MQLSEADFVLVTRFCSGDKKLCLIPIDPPKATSFFFFFFYFKILKADRTRREIIWLKQGFEILDELVEDIREEDICPINPGVEKE